MRAQTSRAKTAVEWDKQVLRPGLPLKGQEAILGHLLTSMKDGRR